MHTLLLMHTLVLVTCVIHHNLLGSSIRTCPKLWWRAKGWSDTDGCSLWASTAAGKQANFSLGGICRQVYEHLQTVLGRRACWHVLRNLYALFVHDCKSIQCDIICALKVRGRRQHFNHRMPPYTRKGRLRILCVPEYSMMEKNLYVWGITIFAAFGGFMFGYDTGWVAATSSCLVHTNWSVSRRVLSRCSYVAWG